eukprot:9982600-Alexandrium_andersonii.AAC.1
MPLGTAGSPELLGVRFTRRHYGRALLSRCPIALPALRHCNSLPARPVRRLWRVSQCCEK